MKVDACLLVLKVFGLSKLWYYQEMKELMKKCKDQKGENTYFVAYNTLVDCVTNKCSRSLCPQDILELMRDFQRCAYVKGVKEDLVEETARLIWNIHGKNILQVLSNKTHHVDYFDHSMVHWLVCLKCLK